MMDTAPERNATVSIVRCEDYDPDRVAAAVQRLVDLLGGMSRFVKPGQRVLVKPNLLVPRVVEKAVLTDPSVILAVCRMVLEAGADCMVGDGSMGGGARACLRKLKVLEPLEDLGVQVVDFKEIRRQPGAKGSTYKSFDIAREVAEADVVINLPKAKTHCQMMVTLALKNTFGYIVGHRKAGWHLKAGQDYQKFARMLYDLHYCKAPVLNILDGVIAMEGDGPAGGDAKKLGFIMAGADAVSLDTVCTHIFRMQADQVPILIEAAKSGRYLPIGRIEILGDNWKGFLPKAFKPPATQVGMLGEHIPEWLSRWVRSSMVSHPRPMPDVCVGCGLCVKVCPSEAITLVGELAQVAKKSCIRCYCCMEACPEKAIRVGKGWLGRLLG